MSFMDARDVGSKVGSGGVASAQASAIDRRERLRRLALETIDLAKDPYFMKNHLGRCVFRARAEVRACRDVSCVCVAFARIHRGARVFDECARESIAERVDASRRVRVPCTDGVVIVVVARFTCVTVMSVNCA